jgi:DNA-binding transcriptional LysR family regulator
VDIASVGAELSLWNPLLVNWLAWMQAEVPDIALRAEVDAAPRLLEAVRSGALDLAVLYAPPVGDSALVVELLHEDKLVLVTTDPDGAAENHVQVDWGEAFQASYQAAFPQVETPVVSVSHGPLALLLLLRGGGSGYFRLSAVAPYLESKKLHRVAGAPEFSYSMHMAYSSRADRDLIDLMRRGFAEAAA